ncbi:hypothetical protein HDU67_010058 [Dinochytrium kinnereticum]|nr:hypothetical protein HDU67_010058 [Dinochytrium kinnereticum]
MDDGITIYKGSDAQQFERHSSITKEKIQAEPSGLKHLKFKKQLSEVSKHAVDENIPPPGELLVNDPKKSPLSGSRSRFNGINTNVCESALEISSLNLQVDSPNECPLQRESSYRDTQYGQHMHLRQSPGRYTTHNCQSYWENGFNESETSMERLSRAHTPPSHLKLSPPQVPTHPEKILPTPPGYLESAYGIQQLESSLNQGSLPEEAVHEYPYANGFQNTGQGRLLKQSFHSLAKTGRRISSGPCNRASMPVESMQNVAFAEPPMAYRCAQTKFLPVHRRNKTSPGPFATQPKTRVGANFNPGKPPKSKDPLKPGDWICPNLSCRYHNFARRVACVSCGTSDTSAGRVV